MGAKICRKKDERCTECAFNMKPTVETDFLDAPSHMFCFEDDCEEGIPQVMVRNQKVIAKSN